MSMTIFDLFALKVLTLHFHHGLIKTEAINNF